MKNIVLESARGVKNGKVQLAFSQIVNTGTSGANVLGLLNKSDDRFNQQKPRYSWMTAEKADVLAQFGIDLSGLSEGDSLEIGAVDPRLTSNPDAELNIQITESTEGSDYDVANFETRAKRAGKDGDFITTASGEYIYTRSTVVLGEAKHQFITDTKRVSVDSGLASSAIQDAIG